MVRIPCCRASSVPGRFVGLISLQVCAGHVGGLGARLLVATLQACVGYVHGFLSLGGSPGAASTIVRHLGGRSCGGFMIPVAIILVMVVVLL